jgi:hypothetical protein
MRIVSTKNPAGINMPAGFGGVTKFFLADS